MQSTPIDGDHLSRCYHSLVQLVLSGGVTGKEGEQEEGWKILNAVLGLLDSMAKVRYRRPDVLYANCYIFRAISPIYDLYFYLVVQCLCIKVTTNWR